MGQTRPSAVLAAFKMLMIERDLPPFGVASSPYLTSEPALARTNEGSYLLMSGLGLLRNAFSLSGETSISGRDKRRAPANLLDFGTGVL